MRIEIPNFVQFNVLHANMPVVIREANKDFFKHIYDAEQYIFKNYCDENYESYNKQKDIYTEKTYTQKQMISQINKAIDIIIKSIENKKYIPCLVKDYNADINYKSLLKNMDMITEEKYKTELEQLIQIHKENLNQRQAFIIENKDEIIKYLKTLQEGYMKQIIQDKKDYFKKYREIEKQLIPTREVQTEEQRIASRRETQRKYREKYKMAVVIDKPETTLTEPKPREVLTEEQRLASRKASNKQYYLKIKEKRQQLKNNSYIETDLKII